MVQEVLVTRLDRIPAGEGRTFELGDLSVAIYHTRAGAVFATQSRCPHLAGPLADGLLGNGSIVCPLHDRVFDLSDGRGMNNDLCLKTFPTRLTEDGQVAVRLERVETSGI